MKKDRYFGKLTFLCTMAYFVSYLTRINYQALISEIVLSENLTKSLASLAVTGLFITYGLGQLISGVLGDRFEPRWLVFFGIGGSAFINVFMPLFPQPVTMTVLWSCNGFCQALIWPTLVKILSTNLSSEKYEKAAFWVSCGSASATVLIYFLAPACIALAGWRSVFYLCFGLGFLGALIWIFSTLCMELIPAEKKQKSSPVSNESAERSIKLSDLLPLLLIALVAQGLLRDGISTWTPSYLSETFSLGTEISILSSVALPIFNIFSYGLAGILLKKCKNNELFCSTVMYGILAFTCLLLFFGGGLHPLLAILLLTLCSGLSHGINYILICIVPRRFQGSRVSSMSGLLNFSVYVGSALSTFGFAEISARGGWGLTILCWMGIALLGTVLCGCVIRKWGRRFQKN